MSSPKVTGYRVLVNGHLENNNFLNPLPKSYLSSLITTIEKIIQSKLVYENPDYMFAELFLPVVFDYLYWHDAPSVKHRDDVTD